MQELAPPTFKNKVSQSTKTDCLSKAPELINFLRKLAKLKEYSAVITSNSKASQIYIKDVKTFEQAVLPQLDQSLTFSLFLESVAKMGYESKKPNNNSLVLSMRLHTNKDFQYVSNKDEKLAPVKEELHPIQKRQKKEMNELIEELNNACNQIRALMHENLALKILIRSEMSS